MFEVKNRSEQSWGPLAKCDEKTFTNLIRNRDAKLAIKNHLKKQKKLKSYKVKFVKEWISDEFVIQAESDWDLTYVASHFFKENQEKIGFKEQARSKWADGYRGYDNIRINKI